MDRPVRLSVAAVQFEPAFGEVERNLAALVGLVREAALAGAHLVVLPEMATSGYCFRSRAEIAPFVEPVPDGRSVRLFSDMARELGLHIVVGLPEVDPETRIYYNTAALIGPEGFIGKYRKTHSFIDETRWARDGDLGVPVFETALGRIGLIICMDAEYMEPARLAAVAGAEVIAFPTNWLGNPAPWFARARENGVCLVAANRWGVERGVQFSGDSAVIDQQGVALNLLSRGDGITVADIDMEAVRSARAAALARRRPELYQDLLISHYQWSWQEAQMLPPGRQVVLAAGQARGVELMADQARWADRLARESGMDGLDLILFPLAEAAPGSALGAVARDLGCFVAWAEPDPAGGAVVRLIGPGGEVGAYRQIHGGAGEEIAVFDLPWGRVGMLVGEELLVPEAARLVAKRGADLILVPADWADGEAGTLWKQRAHENETPVLVSNGAGGSRIAGPGIVRQVSVPGQAGTGGEAGPGDGGLVLGVIDTGSEAVRSKELLRKLQPRWYEPLVGSGRE